MGIVKAYTMAWDKYPIPMLIGHGVIGYVGYKKYQNWNQKNKAKSEVTKLQKASYKSPTGSTVNVREAAKQLGIYLGTAYSWYDPRAQYEDDDEAKALLLKIPKELIPTLSLEYAELYGRSLQKDCQDYLDDYADVKYLFQ